MLTHKIRDMPGHLFDNKKSPTFGASQQQPISSHNQSSEEISEVSNMSNSNSVACEDSKMATTTSSATEVSESPPVTSDLEVPLIKRSPTDVDLPVPKRQPSEYLQTVQTIWFWNTYFVARHQSAISFQICPSIYVMYAIRTSLHPPLYRYT